MAQAEDTELRDLVIEALEKNGSLAKIRALLRANIFLAFENECENIKQNVTLDNILNIPEGVLCLSIINEFLEFCNLKNTLFVYKAETRQGKEYKYEGQKVLLDKLNLVKYGGKKEPILITLIKSTLKLSQNKFFEQNDVSNNTKAPEKSYENAFKDDENCTYIVHEDTSTTTTSNSQSDNSSDEKNKLHLRLQLDNSDTDTSSDSVRGKTSSEYIPNEHVIDHNKQNMKNVFGSQNQDNSKQITNLIIGNNQENLSSYYLNEFKVGQNSSSDSTSYVELKPFSSIDEKLLNTTGVPILGNLDGKLLSPTKQQSPGININNDLKSPNPGSTFSSAVNQSASLKDENHKFGKHSESKIMEESGKSDAETADYSFDFSSPSSKKEISGKPKSPNSAHEDLTSHSNKNMSHESHAQNSASSQSSVSISDVADLLSEKSFSYGQNNIDGNQPDEIKSKLSNSNDAKKESSRNEDDSGDFSESPIPSLSNLSLDVQSD